MWVPLKSVEFGDIEVVRVTSRDPDPCCGCMDLRTGSLVCGIVELVLVIFNCMYTVLIMLTVTLVPYVEVYYQQWMNHIGWRIVQGFLATLLLAHAAHAVVVVLLILGVRRERADFVASYLIASLVLVVFYMFAMVGCGSFLLLIIEGLKIYFMCVVLGFYKTMDPVSSILPLPQ